MTIALTAVAAMHLDKSVLAASDKEQTALTASNPLTGRRFEYEVAGRLIRTEFLSENRLRWTYLKAPNGLTGKSAVEQVDRRDIHFGIVLLSWTETNGTSVVDVFDLRSMRLHANAVRANGERIFTQARLKEVK